MNKENKACFIIPFRSSEKDNKCVTAFLDSAKKFDMSRYLIFIVDNEKDGDFLLSLNKDIKIDIIDSSIISVKNNVVSVKKFYGVKKFYKEYSYLSVIDDDTVFVKAFDPFKIFEEIWTTKSCFYKTNTIALKRHLDFYTCAASCGLENNLILKKETNNFYSDIWFSDIPVYKSSTVEEFFSWMENTVVDNNKTIYENVRSNFVCFDYYIYWYWLIVYKGLTSDCSSRLTDLSSLSERVISLYGYYILFNNSCKNLNIEDNKCQIFAKKELLKEIDEIEKENKTHWSARNYEVTKDLIPNDNICLQIHTDRTFYYDHDYTYYNH